MNLGRPSSQGQMVRRLTAILAHGLSADRRLAPNGSGTPRAARSFAARAWPPFRPGDDSPRKLGW